MFLAVTEEALAKDPWSAFIGLAMCAGILLFVWAVKSACYRFLRRTR